MLVLKIVFWRNKIDYIWVKGALRDFIIFSLGDIRSFDSSFFRIRLSERQGKGYFRKVIKGREA